MPCKKLPGAGEGDTRLARSCEKQGMQIRARRLSRSDTMDNYWLKGKFEAEAQYRDLCQGIEWSLPEGVHICSSPDQFLQARRKTLQYLGLTPR